MRPPTRPPNWLYTKCPRAIPALLLKKLFASGSGWIVQEWSPIESDRATPAVGATVDAADLARWLVAQDFPPLPDQSERALRSAQVLLGGVPLSDLAFGRGPLSGLLGYGSDEANVTFVGVAGSDSGASITPLWNAVRWSATALVALALGGWALQLLVRGERSRRLVRDARG